MAKRILVIAGGGKEHLALFLQAAGKLDVNLKTASFSEVEYFADGQGREVQVEVSGEDAASFDVVYLRLVGKRYEEASLLVNYLKEKGARVVDKIYEEAQFTRLPLPKSLEMRVLAQAGLPVPPTLFGSLISIKQKGPGKFGFPFVIKGTQGRQGHAVWSPRNNKELEELIPELEKRAEKSYERFFAQPFIKASGRHRVMVVGGRAIAGFVRPTRWRKRFIEKVDGEYPKAEKKGVLPVPKKEAELAVKAARAVLIDIAGVDIIYEDETGRPYVLEVNSAPRWAAIKADTGVEVEEEIVKYLASL